MKNPTIKFNKLYKKLNCTTVIDPQAKLMLVLSVRVENMPEEFKQYDTEGIYHLKPSGEYLLLLFRACYREKSLFTTLRKKTPLKEKYYNKKIGQIFNLQIENK